MMILALAAAGLGWGCAVVLDPITVLAHSGWVAAGLGAWLRLHLPPRDLDADEATLMAMGVM